MLFHWQRILLCRKCLKSTNYAETGVTRFNDVINITKFGCIVWICELIVVFFFFFGNEFCFFLWVGDIFQSTTLKHLSGTAGTHHCDLSSWPSVIDVAAQLFA